MIKENIANKILSEMNQSEKGKIFATSDFYHLGSRSAIKTALFRLVQDKKIYRLIDGYYTIPYYSKVIEEYSYPTSNQLAQKIAEKNAWTISPTGENALNLIGISTQVAAVCEYISDGPYREYTYLNDTIKFKHTSNRNITNFSMPLSIVIQGIKAIGESKITDKNIRQMSSFCKEYVEDDIIKDTKSVPAWIYQILKRIDEVNKYAK